MNNLRFAVLTVLFMAVAATGKAISIIPTFVNGSAQTWNSTEKGIIQQAISDWQAALTDSHTINVTFDFTHAGTSGYLGLWAGNYSLNQGANIYPWTSGLTHTIHFNVDMFSGTSYTWWDPTPTTSGDLPFAAWDALSVARHEIGHMMGFANGFYVDNFYTSQQFDKWTSHISGSMFDSGGLNVSLASTNNLSHLLDSGATAGDLMVPVLGNATRRNISATDLKMLHLAYGYTVVPEPSVIVLLSMNGIGLIACLGRWRRAIAGSILRVSRLTSLIVVMMFSLNGPLPSVHAAITYTGDVKPSNPATWDSLTTVYIGDTSNGSLKVTSSSTITSYCAYIPGGNNVTGDVTVDGSGSLWKDNYLYVGAAGTGTLTISNGGAVTNTNYGHSYIGGNTQAIGLATVDGAGSKYSTNGIFSVGYYGRGTLRIQNSGSVTSGSTNIGDNSGSVGEVTVNGAGSSWSSMSISTGYAGNGILNVIGGGKVTTSGCNIGHIASATGVINIDGSGSVWTSPSSGIIVARAGNGTLNITHGASASVDYSDIGYDRNSTGTALVDGAGSQWINANDFDIGYSGNGTLKITGGGTVSNKGGHIASYGSYSTGVVTVEGIGSKWINDSLNVGGFGNGTLNINDGGTVSVAATTYVGSTYGSGIINFRQGSLTTKTLLFDPSRMTGTGTIYARGLVANFDLIFDRTHPLSQSFSLSGTNITVTLDLSNPANNGTLGAGLMSNGSLTIRDGVTVQSMSGEIAYRGGSTAVANVIGAGSKWINSGQLDVNCSGKGTLSITNGGFVSNSAGYIAYNSGSVGTVQVKGAGSTWMNSGTLYAGLAGPGTLQISEGGSVSCAYGYIGYSNIGTATVTVEGNGSKWTAGTGINLGYIGKGTLNIIGGGTSTATTVTIASSSLVAVDVGRGSQFTLGGGTGTITNNGIVRVLAGAGVLTNSSTKYSPISAGTWSGTGTYQPIGGTWDATAHRFTASGVQLGTSGTAVSIDLASLQRILVDDNTSGDSDWQVGASFVAAPSPTNITATATAMGNDVLDSLRGQLLAGESVLSGWTLSTTNLIPSPTNPIYLSFNVGSGYPSANLEVWRYDTSGWTPYSALDLTYDGHYASFTVADSNGYAVIAVPEPSVAALLGIGAFGLLAYVSRRQRKH